MWIDKGRAIKLVYEKLGMDITGTWNNHIGFEQAKAKIGTNTIKFLTRDEAAKAGFDFDTVVAHKRTKYLVDSDSVLEYFRTHGRR